MKKKYFVPSKDKNDWVTFTKEIGYVYDKDVNEKRNIKINTIKKLDLHGFSLENANKVVEEFILRCFEKKVSKIIVITGKGLRSKNKENPYISEDLSILKHSVPDFIKSKLSLMKIIKKISIAEIEDGGQGAFYIYLKNFKE